MGPVAQATQVGCGSTRLTKRQYRFDTAAYTQTGSPGAAPARGRSLMSTVALLFG